MSTIGLLTYLYIIPALIVFLISSLCLKLIDLIDDKTFRREVEPKFSYHNVVSCALSPGVNIYMSFVLLKLLIRHSGDFIKLYQEKKR